LDVCSFFFFSSRRRHTRFSRDWSSDVCSSDLIESQPYLEAIRQLRYEIGHRNALDIHLTLVPYLQAAGELKTKPTQHSVKTLLRSEERRVGKECRSRW